MSKSRKLRLRNRPWIAGLLAGLFALLLRTPARADEPSRAAQRQAAGEAGELISSESFTQSPFADFFKTGDYPSALDALDALAKGYPDDPLIKRYRGIVLDRLGRFDEALAIYEELLQRDPKHVPTRFFKAQALIRKGERDRGIEELKWVNANSPSKEYKQWSAELLRQQGVRITRPVERKRFYLFGNIGWEYDSNVILKANDPNVATGADKNASRWPFNLGLGYRAIQKPDLRFDVSYVTRQSLNDDSLSEFNFTGQELALDLRKRVRWWDRDVTHGLRYEFNAGFLDGNLFSLTNEFRLSSDVRFTSRTRTYFYQRFTIADFGPDGSNPPQTSRDGFGYDLGLTQYFYSEDFRSYIFVGEELNVDETRGSNFNRRGDTTRIGLRVPVPFIEKTDFDTSAGLRVGAYPHFISLSSRDLTKRRDNNWDYYVALTHRFNPRLSGRVFYRYINANNRNDFFQYDRHVGGMQLLFTRYF